MKADTINLQKLFEGTISYRIPLFQRPYVWSETDNWVPLWEDVVAASDAVLSGQKTNPHFLGAIVVDQLPTPLGRVDRREIIDGQQRLTTLQLLLAAARDTAVQAGLDSHATRFSKLIVNDEVFVQDASENWKVWPTNKDREHFSATMGAGSPRKLRKQYGVGARTGDLGHKIPNAYIYFCDQLTGYLAQKTDEQPEHESPVPRMEAIWLAIQKKLLLVSIDLEEDDDAQIIFETLNARGTPLLPADLIKNYLFHRAELANCDSEGLYTAYWHDLDEKFWRSEVTQGRLRRPRLDLFFQNYLTLKTVDEVPATHIFRSFQDYVDRRASTEQIDAAELVETALESVRDYADSFKRFYEPDKDSDEEVFFRRLGIMQTATVFPFLLEAFKRLGGVDASSERRQVMRVLESFLVRRLVCGLTTKNYNRLFLDLIVACNRSEDFGPSQVHQFLSGQDGPSTRWPRDDEFLRAWLESPIYERITRPRLRMILEALDEMCADDKSEAVPLTGALTVEHLLPQTWQNTWPLADVDGESAEARITRVTRRNQLLQTMGNLTLITHKLNPALSNSRWSVKQPEILKFSKLNLTRYFHDREVWNEDQILERGRHLFGKALAIWPDPGSL